MGESDVRPWGSWEVLDEGLGYKVKRLVVRPRQRLSYQTHSYRAEHWVIVSGRATCVINGVVRKARPGDYVDVPVGAAHRLMNEEQEPLVVIEVQRGLYTGEDDIVRLEDDYGRSEVVIATPGRLLDALA
ncbi:MULTISPECIES: phosphomannose isomerase type II C-terminal cupin domain [unclassified Nocardioides]|uniref:phosphomannose isomerase type II C-terminal cupin domain n=1 Tax=unclassified Nocardioides TaxID=2615069 RepID=UPI00005712F8|nr:MULTISPECIES: phosphomannose isomerase type II C-terminal cupin domain [unclassified Nocardioides]ABL83683.1 mannose-6-phosphate isomerase, type 2 [Nocardioides sp. JS614]MBI2243334.1 phosphomannose isomerase type II C-terminal cupin domain [Nocardioides sp.]